MEARISTRGDQGRFEGRTTHRNRLKSSEPYSCGSDAALALTRLSPHSPGFRKVSSITTCSPGMAEPYVPDEVREFIIKHIATVPQIEALLLIWSSPEKRWSLRQVAARIYTSDAEAARALDGLCAGGLLVHREGNFALDPSTANGDMIGKLKEVYARHLIPVTDVIHGKSRRGPAAAEFFRSGKCD
jgi:hypothetical protein